MKPAKRSKTTEDKKSAPVANTALQQASLKKLSVMMAIICSALGFFLYVNTLGHNYTVDDDTVMQKNKIVTKGVTAIPEIFTTAYRKGFWDREEAMYRPLSLTMFALEWQMAPGKPFPGHLMNTLLYALTGFVLFLTLRKIMNGYNPAVPFLATILFMAHPLHTEVVANIKSRDELLNFLFLILSLYFLFRYCKDETKKIFTLAMSLFFFLLALLSKESALTFIAVFPLALYFFTDIPLKKTITYAALFLIPLAVYFGMRYQALHGLSSHVNILPINNSLVTAADSASRLATAIAILGKYLMLLIFPHPLSFDYSYNQVPNVTFADAAALLSLVVYGAMIVYAVRAFRNKNILSFCILYFLVTISLVSNIVIMIESTMAERFLYTSSLAFCIALPVLLSKAFRVDLKKNNFYSWKTFFSVNKSMPAVLIILLLLYSVKTISRNTDWKDNYTLLKKDIQHAPNSARLRYAYGTEILLKKAMAEEDPYRKTAFLEDAIFQLEKGVEILSTYAEAFYHLGLAYSEKKDMPNAVRCFDAAKQSKEWNEAQFFVSSGLAYGLNRQFDKAFADFNKAVSLDSNVKEAYNNWGLCLTDAGLANEAIVKLNKALELDPQYVSAWYNKGNAYAQASDFPQAIASYEKALVIDPGYTDALTNIGNCYAAMKDIPRAIQTFEKVLVIDPSNYKAITNLAVSYKLLGNEEKSQEYYKMIQGK